MKSLIAFMVPLLLWTYYVTCLVELTGDHVCHKEENYTETINTTSTEPMQVRVNYWCFEKIRCSKMKSETKEVVRVENVTRSRVIKFCCPGYEEFENDGKKTCRLSENDTESTTKSSKWIKNRSKLNETLVTTEKNPYMNYSGEYGKEFNHYVKMGLNESDTQQSVDKLMEMEIKNAKEDYESVDDYVLVDVAGNVLEPLKHPQYVIDHHAVSHHEENIAMVTISMVVLGMCIFLIIMIYILRKQQALSRDVEEIDPKFDIQKPKLPPSSKIVREPLPATPLRSSLRPSLKKHRSVTFDDSVDEVDEFNRRRTKSLPDAYDVPRKPTSMMDLYAQSVKVTPKDMATYAMSQKSIYHTFPKKNITRKQSLEHIYDEIPTIAEIRAAESIVDEKEKNSTEETKETEVTYANEIKKDENVEKTKM